METQSDKRTFPIITVILAILVSFTLPGLNTVSDWLGEGVVKLLGIIIIILMAWRFFDLIRNREIVIFLALLLGCCMYRSIHRSIFDEGLLLLWISFIWLVVLITDLSKRLRFIVFSTSIMLLLSMIVFSAGLEEIFTNRSISHVGERISLKGIAESYIIYSQCCLVAFFISTSLFMITKRRAAQILLGFIALVFFLGGITSGSRGGALTIFMGTVFFIIMYLRQGHVRQRHVNFFPFLLIIVGILVFTPWGSVLEALTSESIYAGSTALRWQLYTAGIRLFLDNPIIGIGWGGFVKYAYLAQHSGWLQLFVELGILGGIWELIVWIVLLKIGFSTLKQAKKRGDHDLSVLILGWLSIAVSFCFWQGFENFSFMLGNRFYYITAAAILAPYYWLQQESRSLTKSDLDN